MYKKVMLSLTLLLMVLLAGVATASAAPAQPRHQAFNSCTSNFTVLGDLVYYQNVGDNSIRVSVTLQKYLDSGGGYCGQAAARTRFDSNDCFGRGAERVNWVIAEIFTTGGHYLGGFSHATDVTAGCNSGTTVWTSGISVPCGQWIKAWGVWIEDNGRNEGDATSDGEDVGGYGNAHTMC